MEIWFIFCLARLLISISFTVYPSHEICFSAIYELLIFLIFQVFCEVYMRRFQLKRLLIKNIDGVKLSLFQRFLYFFGTNYYLMSVQLTVCLKPLLTLRLT